MILFILLLALGFRIWNLNQSFWLDEAITATIARDLSLKNIFIQYLPLDNHPPLYLLIIHLLFQVLPNTEIVARIPSVLFGLLTIVFVYLLAKDLFNEKVGKVAALLLATSPLAIYYSQEARMYSLTAFLVVLMMFFFSKYLKKPKSPYLLGYFVTAIILVYSDYLPLLILIVTNILLLYFSNQKIINLKKVWLPWILAHLGILIAFLPFLQIFIKQFTLGYQTRHFSEVFDAVLGKFSLKAMPLLAEKFVLGRIPVYFDKSILLIIVAMFLFWGLAFFGFLKSEKKFRSIVLLWFTVPLLLTYICSLFIPVFLYFRLLFVLPAFYLFVSLGINYLKPRWRILFLTGAVFVNIVSLFVYQTNPYLQREQWREAIAWVTKEVSDNDIILFASSDPFAPYLWYQKGSLPAVGGFAGFYGSESDREKTLDLIRNKNKVYLFTYLQDITDPNRYMQTWIMGGNYVKTMAKPFIGVGSIDVYGH